MGWWFSKMLSLDSSLEGIRKANSCPECGSPRDLDDNDILSCPVCGYSESIDVDLYDDDDDDEGYSAEFDTDLW